MLFPLKIKLFLREIAFSTTNLDYVQIPDSWSTLVDHYSTVSIWAWHNLAITLAIFSKPFNNSHFKNAGSLVHETGVAIGDMAELSRDAKQIREVVNKLSNFKLDSTELTCLKAICLFRPGKRKTLHRVNYQKVEFDWWVSDVVGLTQHSQIEMLQDQSHLMLQEYCQQNTTGIACKVGSNIGGLCKIR